MNELFITLWIIVVHFIADFLFQHPDWATRKAKETKPLLKHILTYTVISTLLWLFLLPDWVTVCLFAWTTFSYHLLTDYFTSKVTSYLAERKLWGNWLSPVGINAGFFSMIGFDQVLHYAQLFACYYFLVK